MPNDINGERIPPIQPQKPPYNGICPDCGGILAPSAVGWTCICDSCGSDFSSDGQRQ